MLSIFLHFVLAIFWLNSSAKKITELERQAIVIKLNTQKNIIESSNHAISSTSTSTQLGPAAPTAEEWAFASKYTLKNSKGYRHAWGKQVRSLMGAATEVADQGQVRFRIEIAPNGSIVKIETLWKTSDRAEQLARKAIKSMSALPTTPTGKPLIFERTISFTPFASDDTPFYADDCLPDPPSFTNPFAWDGKSPQEIKKSKPVEKLSPAALAECLKQLPQDSIEGENARTQRLMDQWGQNNMNK